MDGLVREFTTLLLQLVDDGQLDARAVLGNVVGNYMSEDDVKDFCTREYEGYFPADEDNE